jgi:photosystem II stability/assembly factor-like uncharacterized protein
MVNGWYQQFMPNLGGRSIVDITFTDSLSGYAITNRVSASDTSFILKTTNGGDNWYLNYSDTSFYNRIQFINQNTGFVCGFIYINDSFKILKTTNSGTNWFYINSPYDVIARDMFVLNQDTIWLVDDNSLVGGVFLTTNGGASWTQQLSAGASNPDRIYMYNGKFGFANRNGGNFMYRTVNGGGNWEVVPGIDGFRDIYFIDSLVGWKCSVSGGYMKKTTNGGLNWTAQTLPTGGIIQSSGISSFSNINKDTIWANGGYVLYPNNQVRIYLLRTTNEGTNWLMQIPDTSINMTYHFVNFTNRLNGWATDFSPREIHTVTGGGDTFYTSVKQISINVPDKFYLGQNYPNPFNPVTSFKLRVSNLSNVQIKVYDVGGKLIKTPVNNQMQPGEYSIGFDGSNYSSGVYFYSLLVDGKLIDTKRMILIK